MTLVYGFVILFLVAVMMNAANVILIVRSIAMFVSEILR
jgi:hypothetical protein